MVKKTEQAFGELAGSVEAILTLFFLSVTGLRPVDPECKGLSGNLFCPQDKWLQQLMYNYTIITGSYPQIIHARSKDVTGGVINCTEFIDANGKKYEDWIPAIKLYS